jgi:hypothetical protein
VKNFLDLGGAFDLSFLFLPFPKSGGEAVLDCSDFIVRAFPAVEEPYLRAVRVLNGGTIVAVKIIILPPRIGTVGIFDRRAAFAMTLTMAVPLFEAAEVFNGRAPSRWRRPSSYHFLVPHG